jgi:hypothetical protein
MFDIYPKNRDIIKYLIDLHITHPYFQVLEDLYERRFEARDNPDLVFDLNMLMLGLFFYDQKDIVGKVLENMKNNNIKEELLKTLK